MIRELRFALAYKLLELALCMVPAGDCRVALAKDLRRWLLKDHQ